MAKKVSVLLVVSLMLMVIGGGVGAQEDVRPTVRVNGVAVSAEGSHLAGGQTYISAAAFAALFDHFDVVITDSGAVTLNGVEIQGVHHWNDIVTAPIAELAAAIGAQSVKHHANGDAYVLALPDGIVPLHEHIVPGMGIHYANPADMEKGGPVYCVYDGELYCLEYILPMELIQSTMPFQLEALKGYPHPPVVEAVFDHNSTSMPVDHMAIHLYFAPASLRAAIQ